MKFTRFAINHWLTWPPVPDHEKEIANTIILRIVGDFSFPNGQDIQECERSSTLRMLRAIQEQH